ncbi:MAG: hypothetical protein M3Q10_03135 [Chloroflexota bacterium]|nr:hypothetical protein [Chloroflexota bacterium]
MERLERCPLCRGKGFGYVESRPDLPPYEVACFLCDGFGSVERGDEDNDRRADTRAHDAPYDHTGGRAAA